MKALGGLFSILVAAAAMVACSGEPGGASEAASSGQELAVGAAPTGGAFACGASLSCDPATQYCRHVVGGAYDPTHPQGTFSCVSAPVACVNDVTCACLHARPIGPTRCAESNGDVTITILAP